MPTIYMTRGLPASGKTTWAKSKIEACGAGNIKRINKDSLRAMLDNAVWSNSNEQFLLRVRDFIVETALNENKDVIIDDTGFAEKHIIRMKELASRHAAAIEIVDFTDVPLEVCVERDKARPARVGEDVIRGMHRQFLAPAKPEPPPHIDGLPTAIVCDIDGTLALANGRGPYEFERANEDAVNIAVQRILRATWNTARLLFVTGREEKYRDMTGEWLWRALIHPHDGLFMRATDDKRRDDIVKREIYEREIKDKYNVALVIDDRLRTCRMWHSLGLPLLRFGDPDADF